MSASLLGKIFLAISITYTIFVTITSFLEGVEIASAWISPIATYVGTTIVIPAWVFIKFFSNKWPVFNPIRKITSIPLVSAILLLLWSPLIVSLFTPSPAIPVLDFSFFNQTRDFAPGFNIDGVKWKSEYSEHELSIRNESKDIEIYDLRIVLIIPGLIIRHKFVNTIGASGLDAYGIGIVGFNNLDENGKIVQTVKAYSNGLQMSIEKLFQDGHVNLRMILNLNRPKLKYPINVLDAKYQFLSNRDKKTRSGSKIYRIEKDNTNKSLHIDKVNPLQAIPMGADYAHSLDSQAGEIESLEGSKPVRPQVIITYPHSVHKLPLIDPSKWTIRIDGEERKILETR